MRDLAFVGFLGLMFLFGFKRPFLFVLTYAYIDIVAPQRLTYLLLNSVPISLIAVALAVLGWLVADDKGDTRFAPRQALIFLLLLYCGITTTTADFEVNALEKWSWVWKSLAFAIFLPLTLRTRLRIEALALFMVLSAATIIIVGGIKTLASGGGYGVLNLMVTNNTGLYESSIISTVAIAIIPLILFLRKHGTIYPTDWRVSIFCYALIFASLLMPIGTEARTGLVCIAVLAVLMLRSAKRRFTYLFLALALGAIAIPFLPQSFTARMDTIKNHKADQSAGTRLAVWAWTWDYAKDHPFGGGFDAYRGNKLKIEKTSVEESGGTETVEKQVVQDQSRAYHSSYFEMLGEQGYPGLVLWLLIHGIGIVRMEFVRRAWRTRDPDDGQWIGALAEALQHGHIIYMVGAAFVGIAFQPFVYMLVGLQIGLDTYARRRDAEARWSPLVQKQQEPQAQPGRPAWT
ncbi:MAG: putative O-glycosylation ligase, exosortase A system-associated [Sphingomonadales bacterium]|nr:putative O-glycosylation ligase, exosortase A system-associated [Sphingomonadales bacterium]